MPSSLAPLRGRAVDPAPTAARWFHDTNARRAHPGHFESAKQQPFSCVNVVGLVQAHVKGKAGEVSLPVALCHSVAASKYLAAIHAGHELLSIKPTCHSQCAIRSLRSGMVMCIMCKSRHATEPNSKQSMRNNVFPDIPNHFGLLYRDYWIDMGIMGYNAYMGRHG